MQGLPGPAGAERQGPGVENPGYREDHNRAEWGTAKGPRHSTCQHCQGKRLCTGLGERAVLGRPQKRNKNSESLSRLFPSRAVTRGALPPRAPGKKALSLSLH